MIPRRPGASLNFHAFLIHGIGNFGTIDPKSIQVHIVFWFFRTSKIGVGSMIAAHEKFSGRNEDQRSAIGFNNPGDKWCRRHCWL